MEDGGDGHDKADGGEDFGWRGQVLPVAEEERRTGALVHGCCGHDVQTRAINGPEGSGTPLKRTLGKPGFHPWSREIFHSVERPRHGRNLDPDRVSVANQPCPSHNRRVRFDGVVPEEAGSDGFDNLVPIPHDVHQTQFKAWWSYC